MGIRYVVGVDEVGRGPLAGPLVVCAYAVPTALRALPEISVRDSKKLAPRTRIVLARQLRAQPRCRVAIARVRATTIDAYGMRYALATAVRRALRALRVAPGDAEVLLDGSLYAPQEYENQKTIIRGDDCVPVISAASIIGKVYRDALMVRLSRRYPHYGFSRHMGYGTREHVQAIQTWGLTSEHRKTFCRRWCS